MSESLLDWDVARANYRHQRGKGNTDLPEFYCSFNHQLLATHETNTHNSIADTAYTSCRDPRLSLVATSFALGRHSIPSAAFSVLDSPRPGPTWRLGIHALGTPVLPFVGAHLNPVGCRSCARHPTPAGVPTKIAFRQMKFWQDQEKDSPETARVAANRLTGWLCRDAGHVAAD